MLQRIREILVFVLITLLPFHALMVTVGTRLLLGPGHPPLPMLAMWKEAMLGLILIFSLIEIIHLLHVTRLPVRQAGYTLHVDVLDWLIVGLVFLGVLIPSANFIYGFKYTLFPLCLFLILRRVPWSKDFSLHACLSGRQVARFTLYVGVIVAAYGILTFFLPLEFFTWLGYSDLHSLYIPDGPLAAFQHIGGTGLRRIQSTFSGPNQLGIWLLMPLSVILVFLGRIKNQELGMRSTKFLILNSYFLILLLALFLTFSRAAWIAAATIVIVSFYCNSKCRPSTTLRVTLAVIVCGMAISSLFPTVVFRGASTRGHWERPLEAIQTIITHPLGLGLGSAGPASNRVSDPCVYLEPGSNVSWASDRPNLCVFVGGDQVQPTTRTCQCPLLPENWYLQVGVELGVLGFVLFVVLVVVILQRLHTTHHALQTYLAFFGIGISALFLHSWEDAAVAYTVWLLLAMILPCRRGVSSSSTSGANMRT